MPRISQGETILLGAIDDLLRDWAIAGTDWRDDARKQFEDEFIEEFVPAGRNAARVMTELTLLMRRVVRECS
jgi:hypothetical protein